MIVPQGNKYGNIMLSSPNLQKYNTYLKYDGAIWLPSIWYKYIIKIMSIRKQDRFQIVRGTILLLLGEHKLEKCKNTPSLAS